MLFCNKPETPASLIALFVLTFSGPLAAHGDLSERIAELSTRAAQRPADGALQMDLAELLFQQGEFDTTLAVLARFDQSAPGEIVTDKLRGAALLSLRRHAEARAALDRFLKNYPRDIPAMILRARALAALGHKDEALTAFRAALAQSPAPEPDLIQEVAAALAAAGLSEEAIHVLDQGLKATAGTPSLVTRAIELEIALQRFDAALTRAELQQRSAPRPEQWMARRAEILAMAGRINEARSAWQTLVEHLAALPPAERGSHAMSRIAEQARAGLHALQGLAVIPAAPSLSRPSPSSSKP